MNSIEGIIIEKDEQGRIQRVTVDAAKHPELVEDILDELLAEQAINDERFDWTEVRQELDAKHGIQR